MVCGFSLFYFTLKCRTGVFADNWVLDDATFSVGDESGPLVPDVPFYFLCYVQSLKCRQIVVRFDFSGTSKVRATSNQPCLS